MRIAAIWSFVAGDSRRVPLGIATAIASVVLLERWVPFAGAWAGALFVTLIAVSLVAGVFERTG